METVEHKGKVYQIGAIYGCGPGGGLAKLLGLTDIHEYPFRTDVGNYGFISAISGELGTIEDAPLELVDGEWYMVELINRSTVTCLYRFNGAWIDNERGGIDIPIINAISRMVRA